MTSGDDGVVRFRQLSSADIDVLQSGGSLDAGESVWPAPEGWMARPVATVRGVDVVIFVVAFVVAFIVTAARRWKVRGGR